MLSLPLAPVHGARLLVAAMRLAGGPGSGNFGHAGRPGEVGGSGVSDALDRLDKLSTNGELVSSKLFTESTDADMQEKIDQLIQEKPAAILTQVAVKGLIPLEDIQTSSLIETFIKDPSLGHVNQPIRIARYQGKTYIVDGHHRVAAAILRGETKVKARLYSLAAHVLPLHAAADLHVQKLAVAFRYAFARARKAKTADAAVKALKAALLEVLPAMLLKVVAAGGEVGVAGLKKLKVAGGLGSGNFGHEGRPGEVGGSGAGGGRYPEREHGTRPTVHPATIDSLSRTEPLMREYLAAKSVERAYGYSPRDGRVSFTARGSEHKVTADRQSFETIRGGVFTHSHPSGSSFSGQDMLIARRYELAEIRAVTSDGTFVLGPPSGGWGAVSSSYDDDVKQEFSRIGGYINANVERIVEAHGLHYRYEGKKLRTGGAMRTAAKKPIAFTFDAASEAAVSWADKHAAELITNISETTRDRINEAIANRLETGEDATDAIAEAVGDDDRAELIARHETMMAASEGQREAWDQAVDAGLLTGDEKRVWIVTPDDALCPICEDLDGEEAGLDEEYPGGYDGPPAHVNCRCTEGLT